LHDPNHRVRDHEHCEDTYQLQPQSNLNANYSLEKLRQAVSHKCNANETPTIIQFNNVKDAVISVGISSNGRILDGDAPHVIHGHQRDQANNNHIIIARRDGRQSDHGRDQNQASDHLGPREEAPEGQQNGTNLDNIEASSARRKWAFSSFGNRQMAGYS